MNPYLTDYHCHSRQSVDAGDSMMDFARFAAKNGVSEICFTDHVDFSSAVTWRDYFDYEAYSAELADARGNAEGVTLLAGFEIDYQKKHEPAVRAFLADKRVDFVIGSVHFVDDKLAMIMNYFQEHAEDEAYELYFDEVLSAAASGLFDVLGHMDYAKRAGAAICGPFPFERFKKKITEILKAAIDTRTGIEVNAAGFSHAPAEPYPGLETLKLYKSLGGRVLTFGSDSHYAETVGTNIGMARKLALDAGFTEFTLFRNRESRFVSL